MSIDGTKTVNNARWHVTSLYSIEETWSKYVKLIESTKPKRVTVKHTSFDCPSFVRSTGRL